MFLPLLPFLKRFVVSKHIPTSLWQATRGMCHRPGSRHMGCIVLVQAALYWQLMHHPIASFQCCHTIVSGALLSCHSGLAHMSVLLSETCPLQSALQQDCTQWDDVEVFDMPATCNSRVSIQLYWSLQLWCFATRVEATSSTTTGAGTNSRSQKSDSTSCCAHKQ
jgi:hypothetical protein